MCRPIQSRGFEAECEVVGIDKLQSARCQRRAHNLATQPLQTRPILGLDTRGHMQGKPRAEKHKGPLRARPDPLSHHDDVIEHARRRQRAQYDAAQGDERRRLAHFVQFCRRCLQTRGFLPT